MKFAKEASTGKKILATPNARAICFCCEKEMVAKCGEIKIHHWAHKVLQECDHWWENETLWHREWKDRFPMDWQEVVKCEDATGERHIADVYNPKKDLVIEFQNSPIKVQEIQARERYYMRMLWLLNGTKISFLTIPIDESNKDLKRLKARVKAKHMQAYRQEKSKIEDQIREVKKQRQVIEDQFSRKEITNIQWLEKSDEIDWQVKRLKKRIERKKQEAHQLANKALEFGDRLTIKRNHESRVVIYDWKFKNPGWAKAKCPIFVDFQGELFLLKTDHLAVAVPVRSFFTKYRG